MTEPLTGRLYLRLPATSANLGPGFDALGLAMSLYLEIEAEPAEAFHIDATGRNADLCSDVATSLILATYRDLLGRAAVPLSLKLVNGIPLGMGCGSSAAALLAGVLLASHFGRLDWEDQQILEEACRREGHPDNVAACFYGGMTSSATFAGGKVVAASCGRGLDWRLFLALPSASLSTAKARALLPATYNRADAVANVQSVALLVSAFAQNSPHLLRYAMRDCLHQPYRLLACPLLAKLLVLMEAPDESGIAGVALSGAGPAVLVLASPVADAATILELIRAAGGEQAAEILPMTIARGCAIWR